MIYQFGFELTNPNYQIAITKAKLPITHKNYAQLNVK